MNPTDDPNADITPRELHERLAAGAPPDVLLDVREPHEHSYAHIAGARLIPLRQLPSALSTLDPEAEIVVYCHHGSRSAHAAQHLRAIGFRSVRNLIGGIDRWSQEVDPGVRRY